MVMVVQAQFFGLVMFWRNSKHFTVKTNIVGTAPKFCYIGKTTFRIASFFASRNTPRKLLGSVLNRLLARNERYSTDLFQESGLRCIETIETVPILKACPGLRRIPLPLGRNVTL